MDAPKDILHVVAEGLLAEGMLEEEDWDKEIGLTGSVIQGLRRWALENLPAYRLENGSENDRPWAMLPSFEIGIGDRCQTWQVSVPDDIGGFALLLNDEEDIATSVTVGAQVQALEHWQAGAGESILAMLYHGLAYTISAASPRWALALLGRWWEGRDLNEEYEDEDCPNEFRQRFPKIALKPRWRVQAMSEVLRRAEPYRPEDWRSQAVHTAWLLRRTLSQWNRAWKRGKCRGDDARYYEVDFMAPVIIQWEERDEVARVYDDAGEMAYQIGLSPCAWLAQFPSGDVEGVRVAARSLRYALRVVSLCDILLALLDAPMETKVQALRERIVAICAPTENQVEIRERVEVRV